MTSDQSLSILAVAREFCAGGAAYLALRQFRRLRPEHRVVLLVTGEIDTRVTEQLPAHVELVQLSLEAPGRSATALECRQRLLSVAPAWCDRRYDVVMGTSVFPDYYACAAFGMARAPLKLLFLVDEGLILPHLPDGMRAAMRTALVAADHLVPVSRGLLDALARVEPLVRDIAATVLPPPVDPPGPTNADSPYPQSPGEALPRVVTVARLSPEKQIGACLSIHRKLRDEGLEFCWHVLGEGEEADVLRDRIVRLGMEDRFFLEGHRSDARAWIGHADLFVLFSKSEGCPTVVREALAEGTPVLMTEVNGAREMVEDGVTGLVVPNAEQAMIDALRRLLGEGSPLGDLRDNARRRIREDPSRRETELLNNLLTVPPRSTPRPLVSILVATFEQERYIARAVASALMQDFASLEVVVCDDASTDGTFDRAMAWSGDRRLRVIRNDSNLGRVANYRQALERHARGSWVLMLDGDDYLLNPTFVSEAMAVLARHEDRRPLFVQAGQRIAFENGRGEAGRGAFVDLVPMIDRGAQVMSGREYLEFVYATRFFTHLGTLYDRQAAIRCGFYARDISSADMDSLLRLSLEGNVIVLKAIAGCWVQHGANASASLPLARISENVRIFRDIAKTGAARGIVDIDDIDRVLTRYESETLAALFQNSMADPSMHFPDAIRMLLVAVGVNPRVLLERGFLSSWLRYARRLGRRSASRALSLVAKWKRALTGSRG